MANTARKRFFSVCTSFSDEEAIASLSQNACGPDANPPEHQHPYEAMLCCHRLHDSLLSSDSRFTAYRGILNWIIILLWIEPIFQSRLKTLFSDLQVLTHAHLFLENFIQHGFLIDLKKIMEHLTENNLNWPSFNLILAANVFAVTALLLEHSQEKGKLSSTHAHCLHLANLGLLMMVSALASLLHPTISTGGAFFTLWSYTVLCLKLYSYHETNRWYRQEEEKNESCSPKSADEHLTFKDLYYFLLAPTLCYQRAFPRSPKVRMSNLLHRLLEMGILIQIMVGIVQQWIEPIFQRSENSFSTMDFTMRVEHLVGLVAPTHFLWLLLFFLCHSYLNLCAEVLRFGDRHFYGDWWNASSLITLWRNWNIPFQKWGHRHMYTRLVEANVCPWQAELLVFLLSAVLCEYVIALPLHSCRMWIFLMMVFELLVTVFLGRYFTGNYGNGLVWLCLLLGPPLAVTMYFHDHYLAFVITTNSSSHHHHPQSGQ